MIHNDDNAGYNTDDNAHSDGEYDDG